MKRDEPESNAVMLELFAALTDLMRWFPIDSDLAKAGWSAQEISEAMDAWDRANVALYNARNINAQG